MECSNSSLGDEEYITSLVFRLPKAGSIVKLILLQGIIRFVPRAPSCQRQGGGAVNGVVEVQREVLVAYVIGSYA